MIRQLILKSKGQHSMAKILVTTGILLFAVVAIVLLVNVVFGLGLATKSGALISAAIIALIAAPLTYWFVMLPVNKSVQNLLQGPIIDEETRTLNQRGIIITLLELMAMAERYGNELSVALIKLGDADEVEKTESAEAKATFMGGAADVIAEALRMPDRLGRYSGDSFMMILPETTQDNADLVASRVQEALQSNGVRLNDSKVVKPEIFTTAATQYEKGEDLAGITERIEGLLKKAALPGK